MLVSEEAKGIEERADAPDALGAPEVVPPFLKISAV